jgi:hypothetical protein
LTERSAARKVRKVQGSKPAKEGKQAMRNAKSQASKPPVVVHHLRYSIITSDKRQREGWLRFTFDPAYDNVCDNARRIRNMMRRECIKLFGRLECVWSCDALGLTPEGIESGNN